MRRTIPLAFLALAGCVHPRTVIAPCVTPEQVQQLRDAAPPHVKELLTGKADEDLRIIAGSAVRLRTYSDELLGVLEVCSR